MKKVDFDDTYTNQVVRRSGSKSGLIQIVEKHKDHLLAKIVDSRFAPSKGMDKAYPITREQFNSYGYQSL